MRKIVMLSVMGLALVLPWTAMAEGSSQIGGGVNYWVAVDNIDVKNVDDNGFSYLVSYRYQGDLLGLGVDVEMLPDRFGEDTYAPQAYLTLGKAVYVGAGAGYVYSDGDFAEDPFFSLRAGLNLEVLPGLNLDVYGQYRFESTQDLKDEATDIDTDTVFLGAALRLSF